MHKLKNLSITVLVLAILITGFVGGLAADKPKQIKVALVKNTSDYKTAKPLVEEWSEKTGIDVEVINENTTSYPTTYVMSGRTGNPDLDVFMFWDFYLDQFKPFLTPLDGSYDKDIDLTSSMRSDFIDRSIKGYQGHIYQLPYSLDTRLLYYRKDLLRQAGFSTPPETWRELVTYAEKLTKDKDGDGVIDVWGFASLGEPGDVYSPYTFADFYYQAGGESLFGEDGQPLFNNDAGVQALQFMVDLRNKYEVMPPDVVSYSNNEIHTGFLAGKFAMVNHWPYMWGMIQDSELAGKVGYAEEPYPEGESPKTIFNRWSFGIPKNSDKKETAFDLIKFLTSKQAGIDVLSNKLDWPLRQSVYESKEIQENLSASFKAYSDKIFQISADYGKLTIPPRGSETLQILAEQMDKAMLGQKSPKSALNDAAAEITKLLN